MSLCIRSISLDANAPVPPPFDFTTIKKKYAGGDSNRQHPALKTENQPIELCNIVIKVTPVALFNRGKEGKIPYN